MIRKLLEKYWSNNSSLEEKKELLEIIDNPKVVSEKITQTWSENDNTIMIDKRLSRKVLQKIHQKINETHKTKKHFSTYSSFIKFSIAASLVLYCVFGLLYHKNIASTSTVALVNYDTISNETADKLMNIRLNDNSTVVLYPKSEIVYDGQFNQKNRAVLLMGKAKFKVYKNKELPFTVSIKSFTTTALGTEFIVTENIKNNQASVQLLEGKVRIDSQKKAAFESVFLNAGENFWLDLENNQVQITNQKISKPKTVSTKKYTEKTEIITLPEIPETEKNNEITDEIIFDKTPLIDVFDKIEKTYQTKIHTTNIPKELTFTGRFKSTDNYQQIIEIICQLNDLQYQAIDKQVYIEK